MSYNGKAYLEYQERQADPESHTVRGNYKRHKEQPRRIAEVVHRPPDPWDSMTAEEKNKVQDEWLKTKGII